MPSISGTARYVSVTTSRIITFHHNDFLTLEQTTVSPETLPPHETFSLLWGDAVLLLSEHSLVIASHESGSDHPTSFTRYVHACARAHEGWVPLADLVEEPPRLLECYFIDVGQGDSILIHTPNNHWVMVDCGNRGHAESHDKSGFSFLRWKFQDELQQGKETPIKLDALVVTHQDEDHFSGLIDVLMGRKQHSKDGSEIKVEIEKIFHNGINKKVLSESQWDSQSVLEVSQLMDRSQFEASVLNLAEDESARQHLNEVLGAIPEISRLALQAGSPHTTLPPIDDSPGFSIQVLGPIETTRNGVTGLDIYEQNAGKTANGNSIVLRVDYGDARILLAGDLNSRSEQALLEHHSRLGAVSEKHPAPFPLVADVLKFPHHGSDDFNIAFMEGVNPHAFVFMSGDNERYSHPRPEAIGMTGLCGKRSQNYGAGRVRRHDVPLAYCTELFRSSRIHSKPVYGLVNLRTDGRTILMATLNEAQDTFDVCQFAAGTWKR